MSSSWWDGVITVATEPRAVVARVGELQLVRAEGRAASLLLEEERAVVRSHEDRPADRRYRGRVEPVPGIRGRPAGADVAVAAALTAAGWLELLLAHEGDGNRLWSAVFLPLVTVPLAWRRSVALLPLVATAVAMAVQAPLDGLLVGHAVTPIIALLAILYSAGRHAAGRGALVVAALAIAGLATTRVLADPAVERTRDVLLTFVVVPLPFLVGRWVRGQVLLRRELARKARRLEREREGDARDAAAQERMRLAADLQAAATGSLTGIVRTAGELRERLAAGRTAEAGELLARIAATAREALADVRRILGVLRHEGAAPPLAPPGLPAAPVMEDVPPAALARTRPAAPARDRHVLQDRLLVAALALGAQVEMALVAPGDSRALAAFTALALPLPLLARRAHPLATALGVLGAIALQSAAVEPDDFPAFAIASIMCASYAVGAHADRRRAVAGLVLTAAGAVTHAAMVHPDGTLAALIGGVAVPWTVGRIVRGHAQLTGEEHERAAAAETARVREARAAITAERARVARELHDAIAHSISVIAIQAAGAEGIVERDPARAADVVGLIESVARETLGEVDRLAGAEAGGSPATLARVDVLAQRARESGLPVEVSVEGRPTALPSGVDLAAFRIVQEALANTSKHAGAARAWVVVRYAGDAVEVEIADDGRGDDGPGGGGGGLGLPGMRERVALYGGTLHAGARRGGGFRVRARLPVGGA